MEKHQSIEKTLIIIPTYNEKNCIRTILEKLFSLSGAFDVLIVDDNSPDGTADIIKQMQSDFSRLYLIVRTQKTGLADAYKCGFSYAAEKGYDVLIQMDADLSHDPDDVLKMLGLIKDNDIVIGSRYLKRSKIVSWSFSRRVLSSLANSFSRLMLRSKIHDLTSGFKCIRRSVLEKIDYQSIPTQGYAFQIELAVRAEQQGVKILEYPIVFKGRTIDRSKLSGFIIKEAFKRLWELRKIRP